MQSVLTCLREMGIAVGGSLEDPLVAHALLHTPQNGRKQSATAAVKAGKQPAAAPVQVRRNVQQLRSEMSETELMPALLAVVLTPYRLYSASNL